MENPLNKNNSSINKKSLIKLKSSKPRSIKISINESNKFDNNNPKIKSLSKSKTINNEQLIKTSNLNIKIKNNENPMQKSSSSVTIKKNKSNKGSKVDFSKYDIQNMEYIIDKNMKNYGSKNFQENSFLSRMQIDIKNRQSKEEKRKHLLEEYKPKGKEEERIKCFNRLIDDSNKRNKIKENIVRQNEFFASGISPKKMSKKKWDYIYENRFYKYQEKIDNNLRERIIEKEKKIKQEEEGIIEQINSYTKKVNKKELDKIINRLYIDSKKKDINKKLDNLALSNKDKANGMKKAEKSEENINLEDNLDLTRRQKPHHTIKSTKLREKKNSYFGSVIIKTSTFEQGKTNSLIKFIQNIGKTENKLEKRHTITTEQKEIKEMESENLNISNLNNSNNNIENNNNMNKKLKNMKRTSNIWSNDIQIKKSQSLKRILVNDFNNIKSNYKNKSEKKIKKKNNALNIINPEYYKKYYDDEENSILKINDINLNEFIINDLKKNMNTKNKINKNKHFNCPNFNNYNSNKNISLNSNINNKIFTDKASQINNNKHDNNIKRFIDEASAIKIVEDIFVNKIKNI